MSRQHLMHVAAEKEHDTIVVWLYSLEGGSSGGNKKARTTPGGGKQHLNLAEDTFAYCH